MRFLLPLALTVLCAATVAPAFGETPAIETRGIWSLTSLTATAKAPCIIEGRIPLGTLPASGQFSTQAGVPLDQSGRFSFIFVPPHKSSAFGATTGILASGNHFIQMAYASVQVDGRPFPGTLVGEGSLFRLDGDVAQIAKAKSLIVTYGFLEAPPHTVTFDLSGLPDIYARFAAECPW
jgi:hypothetical protein